jgi:hypothetical protein
MTLRIEDAKFRFFNGRMEWVIQSANAISGKPLFLHHADKAQLMSWIARRNAESAAAATRANSDFELRNEVVEELMSQGIAQHVALARTNTEAKLLAEARTVGAI